MRSRNYHNSKHINGERRSSDVPGNLPKVTQLETPQPSQLLSLG